VFDPGRLLVVKVGNLSELIFVVRLGNLSELI